jgi:hypothetical protein
MRDDVKTRLLVLVGLLPSLALGQTPPPPPASAAPPAQPAAAPKPAPAAPAANPPAPQAAAPAAAPAKADASKLPAEKAGQALFDEALQDYFADHKESAARKLYAFIEGSPPTDENHPWAQYFLARCFIDLGLRHAGAVYLARVARERSNPQVLPRTLEALRTLILVPHDEILIDEQVFGSLDLGFLPDTVSDYANYEQGLVDLRVGNERWANTHFAKLEEGSVEASRAKFALLVTRLRKLAGKDVPDDMIEDFLALSNDDKLTQEARNEARLAVARLRYERKDFEGALKAYDMVQLPSLDPGRATLYL